MKVVYYLFTNSCNKCSDVCVQEASCLSEIIDCFHVILEFLLYWFSIIQGKCLYFLRTYICFPTSSFWSINVKPSTGFM